MQIKIRLFATLREGRWKENVMEFPEGSTPEEIMKTIGVPREEVAILLVNGLDGKFDQPLKDQDTVSIFPPVGGG